MPVSLATLPPLSCWPCLGWYASAFTPSSKAVAVWCLQVSLGGGPKYRLDKEKELVVLDPAGAQFHGFVVLDSAAGEQCRGWLCLTRQQVRGAMVVLDLAAGG